MWLAPIAAVEYPKAALAFASNHSLGIAIAKLDLANRRNSGVNLPKNYRCALLAHREARHGTG